MKKESKIINVLLVDDDQSLCRRMKDVLETINDCIHISAVYAAKDALSILNKAFFHVMVTDIRMPEMDGFALIRQLHTICPDTQVIIMTAYGDIDYVIEAMQLGTINFYKKPFDIHQLHEGIIKAYEQFSLQKKIYDNEKRFRTVCQSAQDAIVLINHTGDIKFWNAAAERLFGYHLADMLEQKIHQRILPKRFHQQFLKWLDQFNQNQTDILPDYPIKLILNAKNHRIQVELTLSKVLINSMSHVLCLIRPIETDKQFLLKQRKSLLYAQKMVNQAEQISRRKDEFLAKMSHEIRTPMNNVIGMAELLLSTDQTDEQKEYTQTILYSAMSLLSIINDILDFTKLEKGYISIEPKIFDLSQLIDSVAKLFKFQAKEKDIQIIFNVHQDVPSVIKGDAIRVKQILTNLIGNALKFTNQGNIQISISIQDQTDSTIMLNFSVKDSGIGIPHHHQKRLFQEFSQTTHAIARQYGGSGLGLSICKHLSLLMGGEIGFDSQVGHGSTFWFTVCFDKVSQKEWNQCQTTEQCDKIIHTETHFSASILIADDNRINQIMAKKILEKHGYSVGTADNGKEVIVELSKKPYDIILMDIQMPEMDGYQATSIIRECKEPGINSNIPIIAVTAHAQSFIEKKCLQVGMNDFIAKPITQKKLFQIISKYLPNQSLTIEPMLKQNSELPSKKSLKILDKEQLDLVTSFDNKMIQTLLNIFLTEFPNRLNMLKKHLSVDNFELLSIDAHTLKGMTINIGAQSLSNISKKLEHAGNNKDKDQIKNILLILESEYILLKKEINNILKIYNKSNY